MRVLVLGRSKCKTQLVSALFCLLTAILNLWSELLNLLLILLFFISKLSFELLHHDLIGAFTTRVLLMILGSGSTRCMSLVRRLILVCFIGCRHTCTLNILLLHWNVSIFTQLKWCPSWWTLRYIWHSLHYCLHSLEAWSGITTLTGWSASFTIAWSFRIKHRCFDNDFNLVRWWKVDGRILTIFDSKWKIIRHFVCSVVLSEVEHSLGNVNWLFVLDQLHNKRWLFK